MDEIRTLLLAIWREACRHTEIDVSTTAIATLLAERMPLGQVLVRRLDRRHLALETVAVGLADRALPMTRCECSAEQVAELLVWAQEGGLRSVARATRQGDQARRGAAAVDECMDFIVPDGMAGDLLVGPLADAAGLHGFLILAAEEGGSFSKHHAELAAVLLEPFCVALENDARLREMTTLREAAEAERRSLLSRLGRRKLADTIVGADSGLDGVLERVELVARSDVPVLLLGETGTGKELIARTIHAQSARCEGPFLRVNCGAIPAELIDSQLFGHERGAFTGAVETRKGWFERAHGGTLLLDEIGELPPAAQVRLLRILQDGWLERVGGSGPMNVDVRIVAATHRDLAAMVREGTFREDLWYRIAVFPISLPPLRERGQDIPALARHFAERAAIRFCLPPVMPSAEDVELLLQYPWPGNIRELAAVIDRAAILGDGKGLEVATALGVAPHHSHGPSAGEGARSAAADDAVAIRGNMPGDAGEQASAGGPKEAEATIVPLDEAMRRHIERALAATAGRIEGPRGAARLLEVNPHTLRARMRKLGVRWQEFR